MNHINQLNWNQWFAGIIDAHGCFYINKKNEISFEIITHSQNWRIIYDIKNKLKSGSVKLRSGNSSVRYRVKQRCTIIDIIYRVNGKLYNTTRLKKFEQVCNYFNIKLIPPAPLLEKQNAYLAGLIDSDGTISISVSKTSQLNSQKPGIEGKITRLTHSGADNQVYLKITSIDKQNLIVIQKSYKCGQILCSKANVKTKRSNIKYDWILTSYEDFITVYEYLKKNPLKSVKMHRIRLVLYYFQYKQLKYNLKPCQTAQYKIWQKFCRSWFKYMV